MGQSRGRRGWVPPPDPRPGGGCLARVRGGEEVMEEMAVVWLGRRRRRRVVVLVETRVCL